MGTNRGAGARSTGSRSSALPSPPNGPTQLLASPKRPQIDKYIHRHRPSNFSIEDLSAIRSENYETCNKTFELCGRNQAVENGPECSHAMILITTSFSKTAGRVVLSPVNIYVIRVQDIQPKIQIFRLQPFRIPHRSTCLSS